MNAKRLRAGTGVPAFLLGGASGLLAAVLAVFLLVPALARAIPTDEDPFPDPNDKPAVKTVSPGEKLIAATKKAMEEDPEYPATPEAVEFALWCYAESGEARDLVRAEALVGRMGDAVDPGDRFLSVARVACAQGESVRMPVPVPGGSLLSWAEARLLIAVQGGNEGDIKAALDAAYAALSQEPRKTRQQAPLLDHQAFSEAPLEYLRAGVRVVELSGSRDLQEGLVSQALNQKDTLLRDSATPFRAASVLYELGTMAGNKELQTLATMRTSYLMGKTGPGKLDHRPAAALAAARVEHHPVQMVLLGDPADPTLTALREACVAMFEPRKILINLDPARDAERIETLMYPAELAPALFVCVESVCSAPITDPAKLEGTVREILAAARSQEP